MDTGQLGLDPLLSVKDRMAYVPHHRDFSDDAEFFEPQSQRGPITKPVGFARAPLRQPQYALSPVRVLNTRLLNVCWGAGFGGGGARGHDNSRWRVRIPERALRIAKLVEQSLCVHASHETVRIVESTRYRARDPI